MVWRMVFNSLGDPRHSDVRGRHAGNWRDPPWALEEPASEGVSREH
jgi:hypothetical protein